MLDPSSIATLTLNPAVDQVCWVDEIEEDVKIRARESHFEPGGGGINVSRALHRLDVDAPALWSKGAETGQLMERLLDEEGVPHRPVAIEDETRVNLAVFQDGETPGREFLFGMPGSELTDEEVERWMHRVDDLDAKFVVLSGSRPADGGHIYGRLAHRLERDAKVILDTSGPGLARTLEEGVFLVKPNREELADLTGTELDTPSAIGEAARELIEVGMAELVVVSLAGEGAIGVSEAETVRVEAPEIEVLSNVGAGDSMVAGLARKLSVGIRLEEAVRYGVAAGADAARRPGTELCTREGVAELLDETLAHRRLL